MTATRAAKMKWTPDRLRTLRDAFQETQAEFGLRIGVTRHTIIGWEKGGSIPQLACHLLDRLEREAPKRQLQPA